MKYRKISDVKRLISKFALINCKLGIYKNMTEERLDSIETALAHHESQIQDLSDIINRQWKEIERLKLNLQKAYDKIDEMEAGTETGEKSVTEIAAANKPPHY